MNQLTKVDHRKLLNEKKKFFVMSYLEDFNLEFACKRMSITKMTANSWLRENGVKDLIRKNQSLIAQKCNITQEEVLNELSKIAFFDHKSYISDIIKEKSNHKLELADYEDIDFSAVQSVNITTNKDGTQILEIKPYNKVDALKQLLEWFSKSKIAEEVHFHITKEDIAGRSAQDIARDYHNLIENAQLPKN